MSAAKRRAAKTDLQASSTNRARQRSPGTRVRWLLGVIVFLGVATAGGYAVWRQVGSLVLSHADYRIDSDEIKITPLPRWIRTDLKKEVLETGGLEGPLSLLESDLNERIAAAFSLHPWVAEVVRVEKSHPARVEVTLRYRKPVCMVEVPGGLYAVDSDGVTLPSDDFSPIEASRYPRLSGIRTVPLGPVGTSWGDARVEGGVRVAAALQDRWDDLRLARIVPSATPANAATINQPTFEIFTRGGSRILWGTAADISESDDSGITRKLARLDAYLSEHGTLDTARGPQEIDLRDADEKTARPRTAATQKEEAKR